MAEIFVVALVIAFVFFLLGFLARWVYGFYNLGSVEGKARLLKLSTLKEAEELRASIIADAENYVKKDRELREKEYRRRKENLNRQSQSLSKKEHELNSRAGTLNKQKQMLEQKAVQLDELAESLEKKEQSVRLELEKMASLTVSDAQRIVMEKAEIQSKHAAQSLALRMEAQAIQNSQQVSRKILIESMQRLSSEITSESSSGSLPLPNEEMKGRIIGKEGRNIRTLEMATGADIIIDDTPEMIVVSSFDPIRRAVAKEVLSQLFQDGRIHPVRIETLAQNALRDIYQKAYAAAEQVVLELEITNLHVEIVKALGRLFYRSSFGQNVLLHSKEATQVGVMIAAEIGGLDLQLVKRACLLHDLGKGMETDNEKGHALVGADFIQKWGEGEKVVNAVAAHHNDVPSQSLEAIIVQIADAISASRPGARRDSLDSHIKRLEQMEKIVNTFEGVKNSYAVQAGRELRIIVRDDVVNEESARFMARNIAQKIEDELKFGGRIKITLIRESRFIEYAK